MPKAMLKVGDRAAEFSLQSPGGLVKLSDAKGKYAVVYFYPRDNTPGCTREAQAFSKAAKDFAKAGAVVYGISKDSVESHSRFAKGSSISIELLSDPKLVTHKAYGAYGEKLMYGKRVLGTIRSTFVVDPQGKIARVFPSVKVDGHADAVLSAIRDLQSGDSPTSTPSQRPSVQRTPKRATSRKSKGKAKR
jgi:thioredoxin-dependent peroxiredoxin